MLGSKIENVGLMLLTVAGLGGPLEGVEFLS